MPKVTFITPDGESVVVENASGSLMETAIEHGVEGIDADCGGVCSCATCHVHVDPEWMDKVGPAEGVEQDMLELEDEVNERSRLSCQIQLNASLDGLRVKVVGRG